uniref:Protein phosphatase 6 regulatory subunit 2 n=1 Tax=Rhinopithecus bieti TaxID=61621 RepID=A0A2K6KM64_RHIBE
MFWKFDLNTTSHVDKLLDKEHVTLQELMDEDDILQECKAQNQKLLDFLCRQQCMEELVSLITQDPPLDMEEKVRFKYPNTACELLTCDVPQISDRLGGDESLLSLLYDFLDHEPPLNPLLASFFSKTIGNLIARKTEQVITFLKKKDKFISLVLKHIGTSALMDLLLRLVSCVEPAGLRQEVLHVSLGVPPVPEGRGSNASQTLCDIVRLGRDQGSQLQEALEPDPLLTALESQDCVEQLLKNMFDGDRTESCLVSGTQVLLTLLETRRVGTEGLVDSFSQGLERSYTVSSSVLHGIEPRLKDFHQLLLNPPKKKAILTTIGVLEEPLGNARLHGARLMAALLHTNTPSINQELCRLNTMDLLLDLFFKYTWNNFLHFQVELCIAAILSHAAREDRTEASGSESRAEPLHENGNRSLETPQPPTSLPDNTMVTHLFQKCCLVQRILEAWEANDHTQAAGGMRRGNMGHLTRIANAVVQNLERGPVQTHISEVIRGDCRLRLPSARQQVLTALTVRDPVAVSTHHLHSSSEDEDIEGAFPNELSLQQAFSDYQIQQMAASFVDQFGFNDEEFADQDDNINAPFDRIAEINFNIDADEDSPSAALFEACCSDRIQPFDDDEDEDIWEDSDTRCATRVMARARFGAPHASESCSKNGPERGGQDGKASSEAHGDAPGAGAPPAPGKKAAPPVEGDSEGAMWTAVFEEPANSTPTAPGVCVWVGCWQEAVLGPDESPWQQAACERPHVWGPYGQGAQASSFAVSPASPCAWNVCVTRKAPLLASNSSSSVGSDSEDDYQKAASAVDAVSRGPGREAPPLPTVARTEEAVGRAECPDSRLLDPACPAPKEVTAAPAVAAVAITTALSKAGPAIPTPAVSSAVAVAVPLGPIMAVTTAPAMVATLGTVTKDRKTDAPPEGAALNGPV